MYYLFRVATYILPWLPHRLTSMLGNIVGFTAWLMARKAKRQATKNIIHVLGQQVQETSAGRRRLRRVVQAMFVNNAHNYLALFTLKSLSSQEILRNVRIEGREHLQEALAQGKGAIMFVAHLGPFDYTVQYMGINGYDITIPVERLKDQRILKLMLDLRRSHGVQFLPLTGSSSLRIIMQKLRENKIVLIAVDRVVEGKSIEADFFDAPARLPIGPVWLAQRTGAALVGVNCYRTPRGLAISEWESLSLAMTDEQPANMNTMMQALIRKIEGFIRQHPEQWMAFTPIWQEDIKSGS